MSCDELADIEFAFLWGRCNNGTLSETPPKLQSRKTSFVNNICFSCPSILKFCTEHGSVTAVLCAKFQNDRIIERYTVEERDFARFELIFWRVAILQCPGFHMGGMIAAQPPTKSCQIIVIEINPTKGHLPTPQSSYGKMTDNMLWIDNICTIIGGNTTSMYQIDVVLIAL